MMKLMVLLTALLIGAGAGSLMTAAPESDLPEAPEVVELSGVVLEIAEDMLLIQTPDGLQVQVNLNADTVFEGEAPAVGGFIHVFYNGMMTRSLPAQINAQVVICHSRTGEVTEAGEGYFMLLADDGELLRVNADAAQPVGSRVKVYFNGAMTMSLPAQIGAELIVPAQ